MDIQQYRYATANLIEELASTQSLPQLRVVAEEFRTMGVMDFDEWWKSNGDEAIAYIRATPRKRAQTKKWANQPDRTARLVCGCIVVLRGALALIDAVRPLLLDFGYRDFAAHWATTAQALRVQREFLGPQRSILDAIDPYRLYRES